MSSDNCLYFSAICFSPLLSIIAIQSPPLPPPPPPICCRVEFTVLAADCSAALSSSLLVVLDLIIQAYRAEAISPFPPLAHPPLPSQCSDFKEGEVFFSAVAETGLQNGCKGCLMGMSSIFLHLFSVLQKLIKIIHDNYFCRFI